MARQRQTAAPRRVFGGAAMANIISGRSRSIRVGHGKIVVPVDDLPSSKTLAYPGGEDTNLRETLPTADYIVHPAY